MMNHEEVLEKQCQRKDLNGKVIRNRRNQWIDHFVKFT